MMQSATSGVRSLAILDDIFPQVLSAFRFEEFRCYLDEWPQARVYTTGTAFHFAQERRAIPAVIAEFEANHPAHSGRVAPLVAGAFPKADLYYSIFINNIVAHIDAIERVGAPFVFTLYPGGGLALDQPECEAKLRRVFASPCFAKVIATQPITRDYLLRKGFCAPDRIAAIYGGVMPREAFAPPPEKLRFLHDKTIADLCFVGNRYMPQGFDKGYDLFVRAAQVLIGAGLPLRCHVVGPYDASIVPLGVAEPHFHFYGLQPTAFFRDFYSEMDAIVSPNRPFVLAPGAFDGFPVGCCIEAGLQAVAVVCTDELRLNIGYEDGTDICLVRPDLDDIVRKLAALLSEPDRLKAMGERGRDRMLELYGFDAQIRPRIEVLNAVADTWAAR